MMRQIRELLFYDDAPNFGGHEVMTMRLIEDLVLQGSHRITFIVSRHNIELRRQLGKILPPIRIELTHYTSGRAQWLRSYFSLIPLMKLQQRVRSFKPDLLVVIQGGIALSSLGILAGRLAGVRTISYLPMTHDESIFSSTLWRGKLRQLFVKPFYSLPHCLVTISPRMADYAIPRRKAMVRVVENGIALPRLTPESRPALRAAIGLADDDYLLLMVGRIEFRQKGHDLAVKSLALARSRGARVQLLVVGAGPDEQALRAQVRALGVADSVHWRGWQDDMSSDYAACDAVLLPSRYEGVPLVMLEAMYAERKIIASAVDGMADMLPQSWTFAPGDVDALADHMCAPEVTEDASHIRRNRDVVATHHTIDAFRSRFRRLIDEQLEAAA